MTELRAETMREGIRRHRRGMGCFADWLSAMAPCVRGPALKAAMLGLAREGEVLDLDAVDRALALRGCGLGQGWREGAGKRAGGPMLAGRFHRLICALRRGRLRRLTGDEGGSIAVEFALLAPALFLCVVGILGFSEYLWMRGTIAFGVEEAARYVMTNPSASDVDLKQFAAGRMPGADLAKLTVTVTRDVDAGVSFVTISAGYVWPSDLLHGFVPASLSVATASSRTPLN